MTSGPGLFSDIGKKPRDLLTRDYSSDHKFSVSTFSSAGVNTGFTISGGVFSSVSGIVMALMYRPFALTSSAVKKGSLSTGDVAALYQYKKAFFSIKVDTESNILTTITFTDILPSTKAIASFKLPDYNSGKLEIQYFHDQATFTAALSQSPGIDFSGTIGTPAIAFGAEAGYDTSTGNFSKYTAGISVTKPGAYASVILSDKGDTIQGSYIHYLDELKKSAAVADISRRFSTNENTFTVGGSYAIDPLTTVKGKLNNHGKLGALLQHEIIPKSLVTISGEVDTKALYTTPRFGLAIALKP